MDMGGCIVNLYPPDHRKDLNPSDLHLAAKCAPMRITSRRLLSFPKVISYFSPAKDWTLTFFH